MGKMSDLDIERQGVLDMTTTYELCREVRGRILSEINQDGEEATERDAHALLVAIDNYLEKENSNVEVDKEPVMEKEA